MTTSSTHQPDNLLNRVSRINTVAKSFKNESGEVINYNRLVVAYTQNGRSKAMELKISQDQVDLLEGADIIEPQTILDAPTA